MSTFIFNSRCLEDPLCKHPPLTLSVSHDTNRPDRSLITQQGTKHLDLICSAPISPCNDLCLCFKHKIKSLRVCQIRGASAKPSGGKDCNHRGRGSHEQQTEDLKSADTSFIFSLHSYTFHTFYWGQDRLLSLTYTYR